MPVRRFSEKPSKLEPVTTASIKDHTGRHELLRRSALHSALYDYIAANPDCTRQEASGYAMCNHRRITDLVTEGLVYESGKRGATKLLRIVEGGHIGRKRDLVKVRVIVYVNQHGEYWSESFVIGGKTHPRITSDYIVADKIIDIRIPRPREKFTERIIHDDNATIIDGEVTVIE